MKNYFSLLTIASAFAFTLAAPSASFAQAGDGGAADVPSNFQGEIDVNLSNPGAEAAENASGTFAGIPGGDLLVWIIAGILFLIILGVIIGMASGRKSDEKVVKERVVRDA